MFGMTIKSGGEPARILTVDEAKKALVGHWKKLADLPSRALAKFKKHIATAITLPSARLRSTSIHDFMIDDLRATYGEDVVSVGGRSLLRVSADLVLQCKKIDGRGRTKNIPTKRARAFNEQLCLPGFPPGMRVTLGYRLTRDQTAVAEVSLVARQGDEIVWREDMHNGTGLLPIVSTPVQRRPAPRLQAKPDAIAARGAKGVKGVKKDTKSRRG